MGFGPRRDTFRFAAALPVSTAPFPTTRRSWTAAPRTDICSSSARGPARTAVVVAHPRDEVNAAVSDADTYNVGAIYADQLRWWDELAQRVDAYNTAKHERVIALDTTARGSSRRCATGS
jgi:hypothetical protein